tara:strand:- start:1756 stop:2463 length:708 start_codon:yes stop_codon:yes gene_type:complete
MRNRREELQYHNRKFKITISGDHPSGQFVAANFPPPNEFAFSDRYSQALVKINRVHLTNRGDTVNFGLDSMFIDTAGAVQTCASGVMLYTDIKTNNSRHYYNNATDATEHSIFAILHNKFGSAGEGGAFKGGVADAAAGCVRGLAAGGAGAQGLQQNIHLVNAWEFEDSRAIEDAGVLCPNPFGRDLTFKLKSVDTGADVALTSESNFGVAASNGTSITIEMEILMLPNPTPDDP